MSFMNFEALSDSIRMEIGTNIFGLFGCVVVVVNMLFRLIMVIDIK